MKKVLSLILVAVLALTMLVGCSKKDDKTITVAASPTPHAEILGAVKAELAKDGWTLVVREFSDYVVPNTATEDGEVDANYFQHLPYLNNFNAENGTHLVSVAAVHYEPFGIYAGTKTSLDALSAGDKVAIPNDGTNRARALQLLAAQGLISLKEGVGLEATKLDIVENKLDLDIVEMEAAQIANVRDSSAVVVLNGNYALGAGLNVGKDALAAEDAASDAAQTFANILVVKAGNEKSAKIEALKKALLSENVKNFITSTFEGAVVPIF